MENMSVEKRRLYSLNIVRVVAAFGVFLYHTYWNFGCTYGKLNYLISQSTFHMTTFFVLSGFVIAYAYSDTDFFSDGESISRFIKKRFMSLFPEYFLIFTVFFYLFRNNSSLKIDIATLPFQLTMLFGFEFYGHLINWGGWFFSLIFMCYIVSPYFLYINKNAKPWQLKISVVLCIIFISFAPFIDGIQVYGNYFCRFFEYYIGMVLAIFFKNSRQSDKNERSIIFTGLFLYIFTFIVIYYAQIRIGELGWNHTHLGIVNIIMSSCIIYVTAHAQGQLTERVYNNIVIRTLAKYSMEIWCATFFSSYIHSMYFSGKFDGISNILLSFGLNAICVCILALYKELISKLISKNEGVFWICSCLFFSIVFFYKVFSVL